MATTYHTAIQQLYVAYFNRPADPAGLAFWETVLEGNGGDTAVISAEFAKSTEYTAEYDQLTTGGVVTQVYQNLFGHAPDTAGLAFWVNALNSRAMTVSNMVTEIAKGAQGTDKVAFESKVVVATAFTTELDTDAEIAGFNSEDGIAAAKDLIAEIETAADATAAIEPAALKAHVAAVVKAGTPFTLTSGLAALGAAQEARADFLEDADMTAVEITAAVTEAKADLAAEIDDAGFATASAGVQAALIADQSEYVADAVVAANKALTAAQAEVEEVDGLIDAIDAAGAAVDAAEAAAEAEAEAKADFDIASGASSTFVVRSEGSVTGDLFGAAGNFKIVNEAGATVATTKDGSVVLASKVVAADYPGLANLVTAANAYLAAEAEADAAADAALIAEFQVAVLENPTSSLAGFTFTLTDPGTSKSVGEIADELAATYAAGNAAYTTLRNQIVGFNGLNATPLADAVITAQEGKLAQAEAAVAANKALVAALAVDAAEDKVADAIVAVNAGTATVDPITGLVSADVGGAALVTQTAGKLAIAAGVTASNFAGLSAYVAAYNAEVDAQAAYNAFATGETAQDFIALPAQDALLDAVAAQETLIAAAPDATNKVAYAAYIAALGVEGAQDDAENLADAIEALEEAQEMAAELKSLDAAITAAVADFTGNDYNAPTMLGTAAFGRTGSDIFVVDEEVATTISNFGRSGDDVLYIGSGFTLNTGDFAKAGNDAVLEVFFVQQGNNVIVTIETEKFGSNSAEAEIKITLTGVDADDLTFENGIISI